jgi:hypothetical protein
LGYPPESSAELPRVESDNPTSLYRDHVAHPPRIPGWIAKGYEVLNRQRISTKVGATVEDGDPSFIFGHVPFALGLPPTANNLCGNQRCWQDLEIT